MPIYMNMTRNKVQIARGSVMSKGHEGWHDIQSVQLGHSEIVITRTQDDSTPKLFAETLSGKPMVVTIDFVRMQDGKEEVYLSITLQDVLISSYQLSGSGDHPMESLSLNFTKVTYDVHAKGPDVSGTIKTHPAVAHP